VQKQKILLLIKIYKFIRVEQGTAEDEESVLLDHGWRDFHFLAVCRAVDGQGLVALANQGSMPMGLDDGDNSFLNCSSRAFNFLATSGCEL
jgi:hypothetical protein